MDKDLETQKQGKTSSKNEQKQKGKRKERNQNKRPANSIWAKAFKELIKKKIHDYDTEAKLLEMENEVAHDMIHELGMTYIPESTEEMQLHIPSIVGTHLFKFILNGIKRHLSEISEEIDVDTKSVQETEEWDDCEGLLFRFTIDHEKLVEDENYRTNMKKIYIANEGCQSTAIS